MLQGNINGSSASETVAVVATDNDHDKEASDRYQVEYKLKNYDLANRLVLKHAGNAGLTLRAPVLISGRIWDDLDADGIEDDGEPGIEGALVKLTRYWFDVEGVGVFEERADSISDEVKQELTDIVNTPAGRAAEEADDFSRFYEPLRKWIADRADVAADTTDEQIEQNYWALYALQNAPADSEFVNLKKYIYGYTYTKDDETVFVPPQDQLGANGGLPLGQESLRLLLDDAVEKLASKLNLEITEGDRNVWRKDKTFNQADVYTLSEVKADDNEALADSTLSVDEMYDASDNSFDLGDWIDVIETGEDGEVFVEGAAFADSISSGDWCFVVSGVGTHEVAGISPNVLYGYQAEVVSYPASPTKERLESIDRGSHDYDYYDEAFYVPSVQHADSRTTAQLTDAASTAKNEYDLVNSDLNVNPETGRFIVAEDAGTKRTGEAAPFAPNDIDVVFDAPTGDKTPVLDDEKSMGDLLDPDLITLANLVGTGDADFFVAGPYAKIVDVNGKRKAAGLDASINEGQYGGGDPENVGGGTGATDASGDDAGSGTTDESGDNAGTTDDEADTPTPAAETYDLAGDEGDDEGTTGDNAGGDAGATGGEGDETEASAASETLASDMALFSTLSTFSLLSDVAGDTAEGEIATTFSEPRAATWTGTTLAELNRFIVASRNQADKEAAVKKWIASVTAKAELEKIKNGQGAAHDFVYGTGGTGGVDELQAAVDQRLELFDKPESNELKAAAATFATLGEDEKRTFVTAFIDDATLRDLYYLQNAPVAADCYEMRQFIEHDKPATGTESLKAYLEYIILRGESHGTVSKELITFKDDGSFVINKDYLENEATREDLETLATTVKYASVIFGGVQGYEREASTGNVVPVYDRKKADPILAPAYEARMAELNKLESMNWSLRDWFDSTDHNGAFTLPDLARISGTVWEDERDDNYEFDGILSESETNRFADLPVTLERYWYDVTAKTWKPLGYADGATNPADAAYASTVTDSEGFYEFDGLFVGGTIELDAEGNVVAGETAKAAAEDGTVEKRTVLFGYQVVLDEIEQGYGVTTMNAENSTAENDSDLDEMTKIIEPADPIDAGGLDDASAGLIVLAAPGSTEGEDAATALSLTGPNDKLYNLRGHNDSDCNDAGLVAYAEAVIAGMIWDDAPEGNGLKSDLDENLTGINGREVRLQRAIMHDDAVAQNLNGETYAPVADQAKVPGDPYAFISTDYDWEDLEEHVQLTSGNGNYRFEGLPVATEEGVPYVYRVVTTLPDGATYVPLDAQNPISGLNEDFDDNDFAPALGNELTSITVARAVYGRPLDEAEPGEENAYGVKRDLIVPYNWTPEVQRPVDMGVLLDDDLEGPPIDDGILEGPPIDDVPPKYLDEAFTGTTPGVTAEYELDPVTGRWVRVNPGGVGAVPVNPYGSNPGFIDRIIALPQTSDPLQVAWLFGTSIVAAGLVIVLLRRRRDEEDEGSDDAEAAVAK